VVAFALQQVRSRRIERIVSREDLMKTTMKTLSLIVTAAAAGLGVPSTARAEGPITAKIPFDFIVGDTRLPAGDYTIQEASDGSPVLLVENSDRADGSLVSTIAAVSTNGNVAQPDVEFETFGNEHFLSRIDLHDGTAREIVLTPSIMERELIRASVRSGN
jgi:hypothetical protein